MHLNRVYIIVLYLDWVCVNVFELSLCKINKKKLNLHVVCILSLVNVLKCLWKI